MRKRIISALLSIVMLVGLLPTTVFAATPDSGNSDLMKVFHLDCGRKYFSVGQIKDIIDTLEDNDYNYLELAVGNDGLRFLLDDMSLSYSVDGADRSFTSDAVKAGIQAGNEAYYNDPNGNALTQTEMNRIISYATERGIGVIPLVNTPGHMDAILYAAESLTGNNNLDYSGSVRTIDVTNAEAVAFTKALLDKYITYFFGKGCTYFNMGADEYANDQFTSGGMGFGNLVSTGNYGSFINYINGVAEAIIAAGMTPIAFNDGIRYDSQEPVTINRNIIVSYWSSGWPGYSVSAASALAEQGFKILNTNGDWYYVLKSGANSIDKVKTNINNTPWNSVMGSSVSEDQLVGAMICLWCDDPSMTYFEENAKEQITAFATKNSDIFTASTESEQGLVDSEGDSVTELSLTMGSAQTVSVTGMEEGASLSASVDNEGVITAEVNGSSITVTPVGVGTTQLTATVTPQTRAAGNENTYTIPVTVQADAESETREISLDVGETATDTITGANYSGAYTAEPTGIVNVEVTGTDGTAATTTYTEASVTCNTLISSDKRNWTAVPGYYYTPDGTNYYPLYAKRSSSGFLFWRSYTYTWGYSTTGSTGSVEQIGTQSTDDTGTTPDITVYTRSVTDGTPASTTVTFTGLAARTATVTVGHVTYNVTVSPQPISTDLTAEFWCTNTPVTGADVNATSMTVPFTEVNTPVFAVNVAPRTGTGDGRDYVYWKSVILPSGSHQTTENGVDQTNSGTENIAVMYDGTDYYYYAKNDPNTAVKIKSTDQLVCYYKQVFVQLESKHGVIAGADWGESSQQNWAPKSVKYTIVETDESGNQIETQSTTMWYGTSGEIKAIDASVKEGYEVYKLTVTQGNSTTTYGEGGSQDIPEELVLDRGSNYEVTYYIRPVKNLRVTYYWLGAPTGQTLPTDSRTYSKNEEVTVDTTYTNGETVISGTDEYTFHGWYGDNTFTGNPVTSFTITVPTTLYGYWTRVDTNGLRIEAASDTKVYDGTPLTKNEYTVSYAGTVLTADTDGWYEANGIKFQVNATVSGSQTNVGTTDNTVSGTIQYAENATGTFESVQWKSGTLTVTPEISIAYYKDSVEDANHLGTEDLTKDGVSYPIDSRITLTEGQLNAKKPAAGYANGVQQGGAYTVTSANEQTIHVVYVVDDGQTKNLSATVDYKLGNAVQADDHIDLSDTVQVLQPDTLSTAGVTAKTYTGWKLDSITINGTKVESLPATVNNGDAVVYNYVVDDGQTKELSYTVEYYKDGVKVEEDTQTVTQTVQVLQPDTLTVNKSAINTSDKYEGYTLDSTATGTIPATIENGGVIKVYYVTDNWDAENDKSTGGDGIPDKYQVLIKYVSTDENQGTVSSTQEVLTIYNGNAYAESGTVVASGSTATAKNGYTFAKWTNDVGLAEVTTVTLGKQTISAKGGETYTFTASFAKKSTPHNPPVAPKLNKADHYAYVVGYPDGTVQPQGAITRAEVATIFFRLLSDETRDLYWTKDNAYTDVKAGDWFNNAVSTLSNAGIINGYPDGTFRPNAPITRAEMAKVIAMFAELDKDSEGFKDIAGHWAEAYIKLAAGNGWIAGYPDGTFRPNQDITRAETMTMINRVLERVPSTEKHLLAYEVMLTFPDNQPGDWYYIAVQEATNSHTYERYATEKNGDEQWIKLIDNYDWTKLEF